MCLSKGGPATTVTWSLNNDAISTNGQNYEASQTIVDTTIALYENKLRIIDKTSAMAGVYRCVVSNPMGSLSTELDIQGNDRCIINFLVLTFQASKYPLPFSYMIHILFYLIEQLGTGPGQFNSPWELEDITYSPFMT